MPQHRGYLFTLNNPTDEQISSFQGPRPSYERYMAAQLESGANNTRHVQAYIEYNQPRRFSRVQRDYPNCHIEHRQGTTIQAYEYCTKAETRLRVIYHGVKPAGPGSRTDLTSVAMFINDHPLITDVAREYPAIYIRYHRGIQAYIEATRLPRNVDTGVEILLYWGEPGTGKTRKAYEENVGAYMMPLQQNGTTWYDGYIGESCVIMDDFEGDMPLRSLLRILDRYPIRVPTKGGFTHYTPTKIIITSNNHYDDWYNWDNREVKKRALARRFTRIEHFNVPL